MLKITFTYKILLLFFESYYVIDSSDRFYEYAEFGDSLASLIKRSKKQLKIFSQN